MLWRTAQLQKSPKANNAVLLYIIEKFKYFLFWCPVCSKRAKCSKKKYGTKKIKKMTCAKTMT